MKDFTYYKQLEDLDSESKYLVHKAKDATTTSYAPYSKFLVGAAALLEDGTLVMGSNQENASYPLCLCAERVVLNTCASQYPGKAVKKLAVVAHRRNHKELSTATPCGACRQVMLEYEIRQESPMEIVMLGPSNQWVLSPNAESLLPIAFTPTHLHE